ncbi:macoilin-1 isoform X2 [Esox lucius]|uniref:macoilin-1 isoform X2 n=1 Tax=Esox lucius TaxID=8010 RepID=UPI0014770055|nr:macoilin-1 isoform X2 [Esox lucius]
MKKRYVDASRLRKMKKIKITEKISESAYTFLKFMVVWTLVLLADFILEFRLEYLWPCWLFLGSVYTTFHCHGLVISLVFVCAAFTLDIFCLIFVPLHWLFFAASTYVLFNYIWHTEKGICMSTVSLWVLLVYTEASLRLKDLKNSHANLSHLFAAHCIGYPVVYLGFDATCYFTGIFKLRAQKNVQSENDFHTHLLQQSLPLGLQLYPWGFTEGGGSSKLKPKHESSQYRCQNSAVASDESLTVDCLQIHSGGEQGGVERTEEDTTLGRSNTQLASSSKLKDNASDLAIGKGSMESLAPPDNLPQEEQGGKVPQAVKASSSSPKARRMSPASSSVPLPPPGRADRKQKNGPKTVSPSRDGADKGPVLTNLNPHADQITKLDQELKRLKGELQVSRQCEQELRSHICNLGNSERGLRPEVSLLRQSNELLQSKILCLAKAKQKDKQTSAMLERKTRAETEARLAAEKQLIELQALKLEEAAILARSSLPNRQEHSETALGKYRCVEQEEQDVLLSALSALQDKAQRLEYNLSAETRIKLDLFSALGDARRQLELAQGKVIKQDKEIVEMKQKIAEVMAVSPGLSYMAPRPAVPQYLTKFLNSERYVLNPRALMYQCLKK